MFVFSTFEQAVQIANDILTELKKSEDKRFLFLWQRVWIYLIKITQKGPLGMQSNWNLGG